MDQSFAPPFAPGQPPTLISRNCTLCGALWDRVNNLPPTCSHTPAEWQAYATSINLQPGEALAMWK